MPAEPLITVRGQGPDLVLLHGWAMHSGSWGALAEELARHWRLHLVDLPGHGQAGDGQWAAEAVVASLLRATPPADWLGWSLGGQLALRAALRAPERVRRLVLLASTPRFVAANHWSAGMAAEVFARFEAGCGEDPDATVRRFLTRVASAPRPDPGLLRTLRRAPPARAAALRCGLVELRETDLVSDLPQVRIPTLWLTGAQDQVTPAAASGSAAALMPHGSAQLIPGAGHAPHLSHPREVVAAVNGFLLAEAAA